MVHVDKSEIQTIVQLIRPRASGVIASAHSRSVPFFASSGALILFPERCEPRSLRGPSGDLRPGYDRSFGSESTSEFVCLLRPRRGFSIGELYGASLQFGQPVSIALNCCASFWAHL